MTHLVLAFKIAHKKKKINQCVVWLQFEQVINQKGNKKVNTEDQERNLSQIKP